jgi:rubrerythrin/calcineurin-like phosphoesterase family protein
MDKMIKVIEPITYLPNVHSMGVIGDPGCEGLGTYNMKVYAGALEESAKDDITLIVGDLVPVGNDKAYQAIHSLTEEIAGNDVYVLRGNHDTGAYSHYFGLKNYALILPSFSVVVLDNAARTFEAEGLELLSQVLAMQEVRQVVVAFHIPVPNHFIANAVSQEEFERLREAYEPWKEKVKYLLCGHVHSRFEDTVDGIPLICTGGGGAMIEDVSEEIRASDVEHHMIHFYEENDELVYKICDLSEDCYSRERKDPILRENLTETVQQEMMAYLKYQMFADRAKRRGLDKIANLFQALASSEYHHARNFYSVLERPSAFAESVQHFLPGENFEYTHLYQMLGDYAAEHQAPLTQQAYAGAAQAEQVHEKLLLQAQDLEAFDREKIYVCPICGFLMAGDTVPERCPVCGGSSYQFERYQVSDLRNGETEMEK